MNNLVCEMDKAVNKLRLKYMTYIVEYDVEVGKIVDACNLFEGCKIRLGAPLAGNNTTMYVQVYAS